MSKKIEPTVAMILEAASTGARLGTEARAILRAALNHPDAAGLFECDHTDYVHVDKAATRVEAAHEKGWDDAAQHIYNKGWEGVAALRKANPHRPEREGAPTMSTPTEPNMQIIENATRKDVRPGDHVVFRHTWKRDGLAVAARREGIAHHLDDGNWCTEAGMYITLGVGEDVTITIRRTVQELPPERDGVVLVPADGHEAITTTEGQEFARLTFTTKQSIWYGPNLAAQLGDWVIQTTAADRLTPGTWKVADQ